MTPAELTAAREAVDSVGLDTAALSLVVSEAYGESYVVGTHVAMDALPGSVEATGPAWVTAIDWDTWEPGHATAAAQLAGTDGGRGLATMLDDAGVLIQGIDETTRDSLARALAEGVAAGENHDTLTGRLGAILDDDARAAMVARTESARAMTVAARDSFRENGLGGRQWLASGDSCPECSDLDGMVVTIDEEFPGGDVPLHPNCTCSTAGVLSSELSGAL